MGFSVYPLISQKNLFYFETRSFLRGKSPLLPEEIFAGITSALQHTSLVYIPEALVNYESNPILDLSCS